MIAVFVSMRISCEVSVNVKPEDMLIGWNFLGMHCGKQSLVLPVDTCNLAVFDHCNFTL